MSAIVIPSVSAWQYGIFRRVCHLYNRLADTIDKAGKGLTPYFAAAIRANAERR